MHFWIQISGSLVVGLDLLLWFIQEIDNIFLEVKLLPVSGVLVSAYIILLLCSFI